MISTIVRLAKIIPTNTIRCNGYVTAKGPIPQTILIIFFYLQGMKELLNTNTKLNWLNKIHGWLMMCFFHVCLNTYYLQN